MRFTCNFPKAHQDPTGSNVLRFLLGGSELCRINLGLGESGSECDPVSLPEGWSIADSLVVGEVADGLHLTALFEYKTGTGALGDVKNITEKVDESFCDFRFERSDEAVTVLERVVEEEVESEVDSDEEESDPSDASDSTGGDDEGSNLGPEIDKPTVTGFESFKLTRHELKVLNSHDCGTFELAKKYYDEQGSFEPMNGFTAASGKALAVKLGLLK